MRTLNDVEKDRINLIEKKNRDAFLLQELYVNMVLAKALRETLEQYYAPLIHAMDIEFAVRETIEKERAEQEIFVVIDSDGDVNCAAMTEARAQGIIDEAEGEFEYQSIPLYHE